MPLIYALIDPTDDEPRYVGQAGKSAVTRFNRHLVGDQASVRDWVRSLGDRGLEPVLRVLEICGPGEANDREREWISKLRENGYELLNRTKGGGVRRKFKARWGSLESESSK